MDDINTCEGGVIYERRAGNFNSIRRDEQFELRASGSKQLPAGTIFNSKRKHY